MSGAQILAALIAAFVVTQMGFWRVQLGNVGLHQRLVHVHHDDAHLKSAA